MTKPKALPEDEAQQLRRTALNLLARREHSALELRHKLLVRGHAEAAIDAELARLVEEDLLNEGRYAEVYAHSRADRGYGPLRITRDLRERGVDPETVETVLAELDGFWMAQLQRLHGKRFGKVPGSAPEQARQMRFLRQRGFTLDQINRLFKESS